MIKNYGFLKRKPGLTREQFLEHWGKIHGPLFLAANVPSVRKYIQNHPVKGPGPQWESDIDGIAEFWFDDLKSVESFQQWLRSPDSRGLLEDGELFIDSNAKGNNFLAEENIIKE